MTRIALTLSVLILAGLACMQKIPQTPVQVTPEPTATATLPVPSPTETVKPATSTPIVTPAGETFFVTAQTLYIRDRDGEVAGYLHLGDLVVCMPTEAGWCLIKRGQKVWGGCLDPNPQKLGCEEK